MTDGSGRQIWTNEKLFSWDFRADQNKQNWAKTSFEQKVKGAGA